MQLGLDGARVLITAASQGLGAAVARRMSLEGARVVISSRSAEKLAATAERITGESGEKVEYVAADVTEGGQVVTLVGETVERLGGLDILVMSSGVPRKGWFRDVHSAEVWQAGAELILFSALSLVRESLPHLRKSDRAAVLAVRGLSGRQNVRANVVENSLCPAVVGLMKSLSKEVAPEGIRFNSVLVSSVDDNQEAFLRWRAERNGTTLEIEQERLAQNIPLGRFGTFEEFGCVAAFLCSPVAGYLNGVALPFDGGQSWSPF